MKPRTKASADRSLRRRRQQEAWLDAESSEEELENGAGAAKGPLHKYPRAAATTSVMVDAAARPDPISSPSSSPSSSNDAPSTESGTGDELSSSEHSGAELEVDMARRQRRRDEQERANGLLRPELMDCLLINSVPALGNASGCQSCDADKGAVRIHCIVCGYLCQTCDASAHDCQTTLSIHKRQGLQLLGTKEESAQPVFVPIDYRHTVDDSLTLIACAEFRGICSLGKGCNFCGSRRLVYEPSGGTLTVVTLDGKLLRIVGPISTDNHSPKDHLVVLGHAGCCAGSHVVDAASFKCTDCNCTMPWDDPRTYAGPLWWPCTDQGRLTRIMAADVARLHSSLQKSNPRSSNHGFIRALNDIAVEEGRSPSITSETFNRATREFRRARASLADGVLGIEAAVCPACAGNRHCRYPMCDANMKLTVHSSSLKDLSKEHYFEKHTTGRQLFLDEDDVLRKTQRIYRQPMTPASVCGSNFKALEGSRRGKLAVTGCAFSLCPHSILQGALTLEKGETLGSHLILFDGVLQRYGSMSGGVIDVACGMQKFVQNRGETISFPSALPMALNMLHAKAHSWYCEPIHALRGKVGAGWQDGEEIERVFSVLGSGAMRLKSASLPHFKEDLTDLAQYINEGKRQTLLDSIVTGRRKSDEARHSAWGQFKAAVEAAQLEGVIDEASANSMARDANLEGLEVIRDEVVAEAVRQRDEPRARYAQGCCYPCSV